MNAGDRSPWLAGLLAAVLLTQPSPLTADYRDDFRSGVRAYEQQRWGATVTAMQAALRDRPRADNNRISVGSTRLVYVPNVFLAIALARLDRCAEALSALQRAEDQGVAARSARKYYREAQELANGCRQTVTEAQAQIARDRIASVREVASQVETTVGSAVGQQVIAENSSLANRIEQGRQLIAAAEERLSSGSQSGNLTAIGEASDLAERALTEWSTVRRDLNIKVASAAPPSNDPPAIDENASARAREALAGATAARQSVVQALRAVGAEAALRRNPRMRSRWEESGRRLEALRRELDQAQDTAAVERVSSGASTLTNIFDRLAEEIPREAERRAAAAQEAASSSPPSTSPAPATQADPPTTPANDPPAEDDSPTPQADQPSAPAALAGSLAEQRFREAVEQFFDGNYDEAADRLQSFSFGSRPDLEIQRRLLLSATWFARSRLELPSDADPTDSHSSRAAELLRQLLSESPDLEVPEAFFSPAFRSFVEAARAAP